MVAPSYGTHWTNTTAGTPATSVAVSITGGTADLYLAIINVRKLIGVLDLDTVSGAGLTWNTPTINKQCSGRDSGSIQWRWARGTPTGGSQDVTFTLQGGSSAGELCASVIRIADAPDSQTEADVFEDVTGWNTVGELGNCVDGVDDANLAFTVTTSGANRYAVTANYHRNRTSAADADWTEKFEITSGSGGSVASLAYSERTITSSGTYNDAHTASGTVDWALMSFAVKEAGAAAGAALLRPRKQTKLFKHILGR